MSVTAINRTGETFGATVELVVMHCPLCGVAYALNESFRSKRLADGGNWYCPNGHSLIFTETESDKQRKRAEALARSLELERNWHGSTRTDLKHAKASKVAYKGQVTKLKKRVANGVCPCCTRHFTNLERHMATKHPDFVQGKEGSE